MFDFYIVLVLESTIWDGCRLVSLDYLGRKLYQPKLELGLGLSLATATYLIIGQHTRIEILMTMSFCIYSPMISISS